MQKRTKRPERAGAVTRRALPKKSNYLNKREISGYKRRLTAKKGNYMKLLPLIPVCLIISVPVFFLIKYFSQDKQHISDPADSGEIIIEYDYAPEAPTNISVRGEMLPYLEENSDTVGVIRIDGTEIDYPVVRTSDNEYYVDHGFDKKNAKAGSIFMDYRCDIVDPKYNIIIYGHHMKDGSMFAQLVKYNHKSFFEEHPVIEFDTLYQTYRWEIFAVYITESSFYYINTDFCNENEWLEFMESCKDRSMYDAGVKLKCDDVVLTLSTCTYEYDDARFVIQARLIN